MITLRKSWMLGAGAALCTVLWFALLARRPLFEPDEGRYAEIPREMLSGGGWVIPHLNGLVYLEKPPLQYWFTALCFRALGETEFSARLCTGLAGFLTLAIVFLVGRYLWGSRAGMRAVLYTSASTLFVLLGHQLTLDMLLSFFLTAALACFLAAQARRDDPGQGRPWMLGCWGAMALAVLTKGLVGVVIPGAALGAYMVWQRDWTVLRRLSARWGLPLFTVIAAPWFVLAARANPQFLRFFFVREHFQRFLTTIEHRTEPWWFFVPVLVVGIMPWLPQAGCALIGTLKQRIPRGRFDAARLLAAWCVFVMVFFSASDSKLIPYILPVIPALALLCAGRRDGDSRGSLLAGAFLSLAAALAMLVYASGGWNRVESMELLMRIRPMLMGTGVVLGAGALAGAACALKARPRAEAAAFAGLTALCGAWFLGSAGILVAANGAQALYSAKDVALELRRASAPAGLAGVPVFAVQAYQQSLPFYLRRTVTLVDYRDEFDLGLTQNPHDGIATLQQFGRVWQELGAGFAVMRPGTRDRLSGLGVPMREVAQFPERVIVSRR